MVRGVDALLSVFDLNGRKIAVVRGTSGSRLVWNGRNAVGDLVSPGVYLYRLQVERHRRDGKIVVLR